MFENILGTVLSIIALIAAGAILVYGFRRRSQMLSDLSRLDDALDQANAALDDVDTAEDLYEVFETAHDRLSSIDVLKPYWNAFRRDLIRSEQKRVFGSPAPASATFNYDLLYSPELHLRRHEAIPNQLVGIGLLFTFLGLMLSLAIASVGLQGDVENAKQSLIALMSASAIKFITSIAAIFSALLFTHSKNFKLAEIHPKLEQLAERIDWLVVPMSREQIAEESRQELVAQTRHLKTRNDELAKTIASELDTTLQTSLKEAIAPVAEEINAMAGKMGEISENTMRYMVDMFAKELGSAAKDHSERMASLLNEVSRAVEKVPEKIELSSGKFAEAMEASVKVVEGTFGAASQSLMKVLQETSEVMQRSANGWSDVSAKLVELTEGLSTTEEAFGERLDAVHDATEGTINQLKAIAREMEQASANLPAMDLVAEKLDGAAKALEHSVTEIGKLEGIGDDARRRAVEATGQFQQTVSTIEQEMKSLDSSMAAVFSQTGDGLSAFQNQVEGTVSALNKQMAQAVGILTEAVNKLAAASGRSAGAE